MWVVASENCDISKRFGEKNVWSQDYSIQLPHLIQDDRKEYFVEVEVPKTKKRVTDLERHREVLKVVLKAKSLDGKLIEISSSLIMTVFNSDEEANI